jgi:hypothetical protein
LKDAKEMNLHTICFPAVGIASQAKGKKKYADAILSGQTFLLTHSMSFNDF